MANTIEPTDQTPLHQRFQRMTDEELSARWVDELAALFARFADFDTAAWFRSALLVVQRRLTPRCRVETPEDADTPVDPEAVRAAVREARQARRRAAWRAKAKARRDAVVAGVEVA